MKLSRIVVHVMSKGDSTIAEMCMIAENAVYHRSSPIIRIWYGIAKAVAATAIGNGDGIKCIMRAAIAQNGINVQNTCQTVVSCAVVGRNMPYITAVLTYNATLKNVRF